MPMPTDVGVVDLMIGFPAEEARRKYDLMRANLKDAESAEMEMPVEYIFKDVPDHKEPDEDAVAITLGEMDKYGIDIGLVGIGPDAAKRAFKDHPDRFVGSLEVDHLTELVIPREQRPVHLHALVGQCLSHGLEHLPQCRRQILLPDLLAD